MEPATPSPTSGMTPGDRSRYEKLMEDFSPELDREILKRMFEPGPHGPMKESLLTELRLKTPADSFSLLGLFTGERDGGAHPSLRDGQLLKLERASSRPADRGA
jgi:hypothetical protein